MERHIRVLVAIRTRLMRELILTTFADQPDIEVVGEVADDSDVLAAVETTHPDFLVLSQEMGRRPALCDQVLRLHPEIRIIATDPDHNYSVHYWVSLDIHSRDVESSEEGILEVLRKPANSIGSVS